MMQMSKSENHIQKKTQLSSTNRRFDKNDNSDINAASKIIPLDDLVRSNRMLKTTKL